MHPPKSSVLQLLEPIQHKWKQISAEIGVDASKIMAERETDAECLKMLIEMHPEKLRKEETLLKVLKSPEVAEYGLALRVKSEPVPESLELERSTKAIKMEFSHLLSSLSEILKEKLPRDVIRMLGCYDKKFLTLTEDSKDTGDVIFSDHWKHHLFGLRSTTIHNHRHKEGLLGS